MKDLGKINQNIQAYIILSAVVLQLVILIPKYHVRLCSTLKHKPTMKAYLFLATVFTIAGAIYLVCGNGTTYSYAKYVYDRLEYIENDQLSGRLPDRILDMFTVTEDSDIVAFADAVPVLFAALCTIFCVVLDHPDLFNVMALQVGILLVANAIAENLTTIPSAIGWKRCKNRSYKNFTSISDYKFGTDGLGGCASMLWSGHIAHTVLTFFCMVNVLEREYAVVARITKREFIGITVKMLITWLIGFIEAILILASHDHYSVDIWISFVITSQILSNQKFEYWAGRINPFIKHLNKPKTFYEMALLSTKVMQHLKLTNPSFFNALAEDGAYEMARWSVSANHDGGDEEGHPSPPHSSSNQVDDILPIDMGDAVNAAQTHDLRI